VSKKTKIFTLSELGGAFGDIGTDFPLITSMVLICGFESASVLIVFGILQILSGMYYKIPMPVQPLKAIAAISIAEKIQAPIILVAGIILGAIIMGLTLSGLLKKLAKIIPKSTVRGLQLGLGLSLCSLAFKSYILPASGLGLFYGGIAFVLILVFLDQKKIPISLIIILLGFIISAISLSENIHTNPFISCSLPNLTPLDWQQWDKAFWLLVVPQIALSLGNSILATEQVAKDFFPEKKLSVNKIGISYALMNLTSPFLGALPVCHGAGGLVGHFLYGGRNGGSVIFYGSFYLIFGLFFSNSFIEISQVFPLSILGVILFFEGLGLCLLIRDMTGVNRSFTITLLVGLLAFGLPYGFAIALICGTVLHYSPLKLNMIKVKTATDEKETTS